MVRNMTQRLTIAIPTYNRPVQLKATLEIILPQVLACEQVQLLLLDNHSEMPVQTILNSLLPCPHERIKVKRHPTNIGGNANLMRCFELCETEWLWALGDDDTPALDAVQTILNDACGEHCYAYYWVPNIEKPAFHLEDPTSVTGYSFDRLYSYFENSFTQLIFISAAVFRMDQIRKHIIEGYLTANTGMPHIVMAIKAIEEGSQWMVSRRSIATYNRPPPEERWSGLALAYSLPSLLSNAHDLKETQLLKKIIVDEFGSYFSPKILLYYIIQQHQFSRNCSLLRYVYSILQNIYRPSFIASPRRWISWKITGFCRFSPGFFLYLVRKYEQVFKRRIDGINRNRL